MLRMWRGAERSSAWRHNLVMFEISFAASPDTLFRMLVSREFQIGASVLAPQSLRSLSDVDVARDLKHRVAHITLDGVTWAQTNIRNLENSQLIDLYYYMLLTRAVDTEIVKLTRKGLAFGKHLLCTGNEGTAVGATYAADKGEWIALAIRDLGAHIVRGVPVSSVLAQACGRNTGPTRGWDGSLHMGDRLRRIAGLVSHLGTLANIATGCAFAEKYRHSEAAVLAFVGDGTTSTGDFHEALNIASVLRLPIVFVIENNQWAFGTPNQHQYAVPTLALRALAYGPDVEGYWVDGTDVGAVYVTVRNALVRARSEQKIGIIEAVTMRAAGHSLADPFDSYVPPAQLADWKAKDPIETLQRQLVDSGIASHADLHRLENRVIDEVKAAAIEAENASFPDASNIENSVFVSTPQVLERSGRGRSIQYYKAIQEALREELDRDQDLFMVGEDIGLSNGAFKITEGFSARFDGTDWKASWSATKMRQRRIIDAPIAEAGFAGLALGAVLSGLRAVVEFQYADFASEAFKMIVNYAATQTVRQMGPVPIVFRLPSGWAANTSLYHSVNPESWFASTPGLKIVAPVTAYDAKGLLKAAVRDDNPVLYLEYKALYRVQPRRLPPELNVLVPEDDYVVPIGVARVVKSGSDISVITYGSQVIRALEAARQVEQEDGASVEIVDLRTVIPWDTECVNQSVRKTNRALVTCEAPWTGSFGTTIVTEIANHNFSQLDAPPMLVAAADTPVPFSPPLEAAHLPTTEKLVNAIRQLLAY